MQGGGTRSAEGSKAESGNEWLTVVATLFGHRRIAFITPEDGSDGEYGG